MSGKRAIQAVESVDALRRRIAELERWFERQDQQIRYLERERQKLSALVNHTDAGFVVFDLNLSAVWLNNVCRAWFAGRDVAPSEGFPTCNRLLCGSKEICRACPSASALATGAVSHREIRLDLREAARHMYATAMPIKTPDNRVDECILMLQDITDLEVLRRSQEALLEAKDAAESANRAKSEFLANMSHEVRTPMTGILSMSTHLLETYLSSEQRECLNIILSCGDSLLTIINDILDFSRIEAGRLSIEPISFDLTGLVDEVVGLIAEKTTENGIEILVRHTSPLPSRVIGDAGRIRQVLTNLVANAIKFTHEGHILVTVEERGDHLPAAHLRFAVEDTGIGIPEDKLASVFEKFTQADGSITRRYGGTGLGLAISKQLVELMGGDIHVASRANEGSTFSFELVLPVDPGAPPPVGYDYEGMRVLVVHPGERVRRMIAEQFASWNAACCGVGSGSSAMTALRSSSEPFHAVLVAHDLPDTAPEELANEIRCDPRLSRMALGLLTTLRLVGDGEQLRAAGFDMLLIRPIRPSQLAQVLATARSAS